MTNFDPELAFAARSEGFIYPNEMHPEHAEPILSKAEGDVYLAVGSERGVWGFGLAPAPRYLVLADVHPRVVLYNLINVALLKHAKSLEHYRRLRYAGRLVEWQSELRPGAQDLARFANVRAFDFWKKAQDLFDGTERTMFTRGNYLKDEATFERVSLAAKEDRVQVVMTSYGEGEVFAAMIQELSNQNLNLAVLDFSNAWMTTGPAVNSMLRSCAEISLPRSVYLITDGGNGIWQYQAKFFGSFGMRLHGLVSSWWPSVPAAILGHFPMKHGECEPRLTIQRR